MKSTFRFLLETFFYIYSVVLLILFLLPALAVRLLRLFLKRPIVPRRVLVGVHEIAHNIGELSALLRKKDISILCVRQHVSEYYGQKAGAKNKISVALEMFLRARYLPWALFRADQVWLVWYTSLLSSNLDYVLYRMAGVDLVVQHCGDDVRCRHLHDALFDKHTPGIASGPYVAAPSFDMVKKLYRQMMAEFFAKTLSIRNQATFQRGELGFFFFNQRALSEGVREPSLVPKIVHAPSDRLVKRTDIVLQAVDILRQEGVVFEFHLLEGVPNVEVIKALQKADLVIDQPATWPARFAIEAAAASCAVVSGNHYAFVAQEPNPMIQFVCDAQLLADSLRKLLTNRESLRQSMRDCWFFWKENYSEEAFWNRYLSIWSGNFQKFSPLNGQKETILLRSRNCFERCFIRIFYHPVP